MAQPDEIELAVDDDNDGGTTPAVTVTYSNLERPSGRSEYIAENHTNMVRNKLGLYRTFPKVTGNFRGTAKSAAKFTQDVAVAGVDASTTITVPALAEISFSLPVGMTTAQSKELRMRLVALALEDDIMEPLMNQGMV